MTLPPAEMPTNTITKRFSSMKKKTEELDAKLRYSFERYRSMGNGPMCQQLSNELRKLQATGQSLS